MENNNLNDGFKSSVQPPTDQNSPKKKSWWVWLVTAVVVIILGGIMFFGEKIGLNLTSTPSYPITYQTPLVDVPFVRQEINIKPEISQNFSISEIKNITDIEEEYGFKFTPDELAKLEQNKFVMKNLLDTNIIGAENRLFVDTYSRELIALYEKVRGDYDYRDRNQANAVFITSDSVMNLFSILSVELLKEIENEYLYDQTLAITKTMFDQASAKLQGATTTEEQKEWTKVRNYFAVPYTLLSTYMKPINANDYWNSDYSMSMEEMQADYTLKDKEADSLDKMVTFVKRLNLDKESETAVLADVEKSYEAQDPRGIPSVFEAEFNDPAITAKIRVEVPFSLFKPRGTYTSSSLRRQYFRAVQWYQQIPFLLSSQDLTNYALNIGELIQEDKNVAEQYNSLSSLIAFVVGESDDLDISDYVAAINDLGSKARNEKVLGDYLEKRKSESKIKAMPVKINPDETVTIQDEMKALIGMRFMSAKFIPDSYWTSKLTQGDEKPAVKGQRLPSMASSLEVMSILGSPYATSRLTDLPFYLESKQAIDTRLEELKTEVNGWNEDYWKSNLYTSSLWSISGMFDWLTENKLSLPQFMQSPLWEAKTLLTGSGFWTELRHTSLLYAKQAFAEMGAGIEECNTKKIPEAPKGYVEPQAEVYDRLYYTAQRLAEEYKARGLKLDNMPQLENYIEFLAIIREYTKLELENSVFTESFTTKEYYAECVEHIISPESKVNREGLGVTSRWEELRVGLISRMMGSLPTSVEGPTLGIKDKRAAMVVDIHTDKRGNVLEEGTGVPRVIFVAVKDANGPRLTVGFTYSQYEFTTPGERLTDEAWQKEFYTDSGRNSVITYKPKSDWPNINKWFQELLGSK